MLNEQRYEEVSSGEAFGDEKPQIYSDIQDWNVEELLNLRAEIDRLLPSTKLKEMDLEKELVLQYHKVVALQTRVLGDDRTPANQLAQVSNAVAGTLQQLVTMQAKFHTSERFKKMESLMIHYMKKLPLDVAEAFLDEYEELEELPE